jgi:hypothetical protein
VVRAVVATIDEKVSREVAREVLLCRAMVSAVDFAVVATKCHWKLRKCRHWQFVLDLRRVLRIHGSYAEYPRRMDPVRTSTGWRIGVRQAR